MKKYGHWYSSTTSKAIPSFSFYLILTVDVSNERATAVLQLNRELFSKFKFIDLLQILENREKLGKNIDIGILVQLQKLSAPLVFIGFQQLMAQMKEQQQYYN